MSDQFKLPEFTFEEEVVEEVPKEKKKSNTLTEDAKPIPDPEEEGRSFLW